MEKADSKLTINDLYIGMEIKDKSQLSNIYDIWILLVKTGILMDIQCSLSVQGQMPNLINYIPREM